MAVGLLSRIEARTVDRRAEARSTIDQWIDQYLLPANQFSFGGSTYPLGLNMSWTQSRIKEITQSLPGYASALRSCPPAFAAQMVRATVLSQARFTFRNLPSQPNARKMFGTRALGILENPWPKATTGQLIARMEWHAGLAGNAYVIRQPGPRVRVLRPDWVAILFGSQLEPDDPMHALDGEVIGYVYQNGGFTSPTSKPQTLLPDDVAHWSPMPDPERAEIGMSWITPAIRDLQADQAATDHKLNFFANGATPNMVVKGIPAATKDQFNDIVEAMELKHRGVANAYRTLYLTAGADATVVGSNLSEINLPGVQGASETRISFLSRVPAALLGTADGMKGSSLNAGNYAETRRTFADSWIYPTLQDLCAATAPLVAVPPGAELWFDPADMPILREDSKDAAEIEQVKATTITMYVKEGFTSESAIAAVRGQDITLLKHTGMVSVQLQPPGSTPPGAAPPAPDAGPKVPALPPAERKFNPSEPRIPGGPHGGEWGSGGGVHALKDALKLDGKIDLAPDEHLIGSGKIDADAGGARMALTEQNGKRILRLGVGPEGYGKADRSEGIAAWDGNPSRPPLSTTEKQHLNAEADRLDEEYDSASPARQAEIDARQEAIREQLTTDELGFNGTARLDEYSMGRLIDKIRPALDEAVEQEKVESKAWDEIESLQAKGNPDPARMARLREIARADSTEAITFTEGIVPGSAWGDVHYEVYLDDTSTGARVALGVQPKNTPDDWGANKDWQGYFAAAETKKFLKLLDQYTAPTTGARAAGHDTTPGHDELHHYWTKDPRGLSQWAESPKPWTTLVAHLTKYVGPEKAKVYASRWFIEVFGFAAGSDLNRVTHGKPPRGNKVGPG